MKSIKDKLILTRGDFVNFAEAGVIFQAQGVSEFGAELKNKDEETWIEYDQLEGIKLTDEVLVKNCGFIAANDSYGGFLSPPLAESNSHIRLINNRWTPNIFGTHISVDYVHELQALFRMFKSEIEIKF